MNLVSKNGIFYIWIYIKCISAESILFKSYNYPYNIYGFHFFRYICNYLNKEIREKWSGYESIGVEEEPLLTEESRNEGKYYQYQPDNLPNETERPKTLSNIFNSVSQAFRSEKSAIYHFGTWFIVFPFSDLIL